MAQGSSKLASKPQSSRHSKNTPKKGKRVIPPKKQPAIQHAKLKKVLFFFHKATIHLTLSRQSLSAKINNSIEQQMVAAASSGKLTIMKPSSYVKIPSQR
ncbi:hypothetical protein FRC02_002606 [Tulasnella sp. 418]|nr:hypothetical protein FRC02_002606 [Tulasnella sp. 418]